MRTPHLIKYSIMRCGRKTKLGFLRHFCVYSLIFLTYIHCAGGLLIRIRLRRGQYTLNAQFLFRSMVNHRITTVNPNYKKQQTHQNNNDSDNQNHSFQHIIKTAILVLFWLRSGYSALGASDPAVAAACTSGRSTLKIRSCTLIIICHWDQLSVFARTPHHSVSTACTIAND